MVVGAFFLFGAAGLALVLPLGLAATFLHGVTLRLVDLVFRPVVVGVVGGATLLLLLFPCFGRAEGEFTLPSCCFLVFFLMTVLTILVFCDHKIIITTITIITITITIMLTIQYFAIHYHHRSLNIHSSLC